MNHIELFSGCGGLSLGLGQCGFELTIANELSPMAAESFAYNFFEENLEQLSKQDSPLRQTVWLNSKYPDLSQRLRENPFVFPAFDDPNGYSDLPANRENIKGKLIVGSIVELNRLLESDPTLVKLLQTNFGDKRGLDLVSGGPPCQSFSMAGLRQKDSEKNTLPWEFAKFVLHTQPKIALLENVTGILRPFKDAQGNAFHAWYEVAKAFAAINYVPLCLHINARYAGIAQNRPRFIMIALRYDHYLATIEKFGSGSANANLFVQPHKFYQLVQTHGDSLPFGQLNFIDLTKPTTHGLVQGTFLNSLVNNPEVTVAEVLDDLKQHAPHKPSEFILKLNQTFDLLPNRSGLANHELRNNSPIVQRRFRLYQILRDIDNRSLTQTIFNVLRGEAKDVSDEVWNQFAPFEYLQLDGSLKAFSTKAEFVHYLVQHPTKKQTQKALKATEAAPAALSIPDDACHYDEHELRVLTVREMARIQSFPDNFVFRSKVTTGGQMRKYEVPQYTQVGNAVPPLLGLRLGQCLTKLLDE